MGDELSESEEQCLINAEVRLDELIAKQTRRPGASRALLQAIWEASDREAELQDGEVGLALREAQFEKWRLIHKYVHEHPYRDRPGQPRSAQWQAVLDRFRDVRDGEFIDLIVQQVEIARNLENGIQDLRPRKAGPTYLALLEYVSNRKRKALAVLHWARTAEEEGCFPVNSSFHSRTDEILTRHDLKELDEDGKPKLTTDPLARN